MKRCLFFTAILTCALAPRFFSQETAAAPDITALTDPAWRRILSGTAVMPPQRTSYGFMQLLDGRLVAACTKDGYVLWQQGMKGRPGSFLTVDPLTDFCYALGDGNLSLQLYNPSGLWLWTKELPAPAIAAPVVGRDGRVFIQAEGKIFCYGIDGTRKWTLAVEEGAGFPLYELSDGSLLYVQKKTSGGRSTALRFSPFGNSIEQIIFSGSIVSLVQSSAGIILVFSDGSVGCGSVDESGLAVSLWIKSSLVSVPASVIKTGVGVCLVYGSGQALVLDPYTGETLREISGLGTEAGAIEYSDYFGGLAIVSDGRVAAGFNPESGEIEWKAALPSRASWQFMLSSEPGSLVLTHADSWEITGYRVREYKNVGPEDFSRGNYRAMLNRLAAEREQVPYMPMNAQSFNEMRTALSRGEYGAEEAAYVLNAEAEIERLKRRYLMQERGQTEDFAGLSLLTDVVGVQRLIGVLPLFGGNMFVRDIAYIIKNEQDPSLLVSAVRAAAKMGYDPRGEMLTALDIRLHKQAVYTNPAMTRELCEAVYQICRFMGRPAFMNRGRAMLVFLLNPNFDAKVQTIARNALDKIAKLRIQ